MIHSRLHLDPAVAAVCGDLADVYRLHRTVMSAFPPDLPAGERVLFRVESAPGGHSTLLVQSLFVRPDWRRLPVGYPAAEPVVGEYEPAFEAGRVVSFVLRANPTMRTGGRRVALVGEDARRAWLVRKGDAGGFRVIEGRTAVADVGVIIGYRPETAGPVSFRVAEFSGFLEVTEPLRLVDVLRGGVGSAKGFGCGLLVLGEF